ncbi:hypothetical protein ACHAWF_010499 [Thalassiosira exigua]
MAFKSSDGSSIGHILRGSTKNWHECLLSLPFVGRTAISNNFGRDRALVHFIIALKIKSLVIPEGLEVTENGVFGRCFALEAVQLPKLLIIIGPNAFRLCINLKEVVFKEGLQRIRSREFGGSLLIGTHQIPFLSQEVWPPIISRLCKVEVFAI